MSDFVCEHGHLRRQCEPCALWADVVRVTREREEARAERDAALADVARLTRDNEALREALHRDRTGLAAGLDAIVKRVRAGWWITEGRGPYEWDDDRYRDETRVAFAAVHKIASDALEASGALVSEALSPSPRAGNPTTEET